MKRVLSLVLVLSMVLSMFSFSFAGSFADVEDTDYEAAVSTLFELGIVKGRTEDSYEPESIVTRAEMAKLLVESTGLKGAAEASKGATNFKDVASSHWATGYINVAAQYGYINGYPDGTFAPDATVSYSEAVTMAIRALGYKSVTEANGTWPTNYIAKAVELGLVKDVNYGKYTDGAIRGKIALLVWNMLRIDVWDIESENENTGLTYKDNDRTMIDKYFEDYSYGKVEYNGYRIDEGKVLVSLVEGTTDVIDYNEYEYFGNDFYTFVDGTEVEVLVNEEDKYLLTMVATKDNNLVEGTIEELTEKEFTNLPANGDYVYALYNRKALGNKSIITTSNRYVEEVEAKKDYMRVNGSTLKNSANEADLFADEIVLRDGERISIKDLKAGDVLTTVVNTTSGDEIFYVVGSKTAEGRLTKYVVNDGVGTITVDGVEYTLDADAEYIEDPEDEDDEAYAFASATSLWNDMKNEDVVLVLDALVGKVVRIEFDGQIEDDEEDITAGFFAITGNVERISSRTYTVELENENGKDEYSFDDVVYARNFYESTTDLVGQYAYVEMNEDEEIVSLVVILTASDRDPAPSGEITYGIYGSGEYYTLTRIASAEYDEKEKGLKPFDGRPTGLEVTDDVVVVTIVTNDNGTPGNAADDTYSVEFVKGLEAIKGLAGEEAVVIYDNDATFLEAKYIVLFDEISRKSDIKVGIVAKDLANGLLAFAQNLLGDWELVLEEETLVVDTTVPANNKEYNGFSVVAYKSEDIEDNNLDSLTFIAGLTSGELTISGDNSGDNRHGYVEEAKGRYASVVLPNGSGDTINLDKESTTKAYENCVIVVVEVEENKDFLTNGMYDVESAYVVDYEDVKFQAYDRISGEPTDEVVFIIRGMQKR